MDIMSLYTKGYEILNQDTIKIFKFTPENIDILHNQTNITKIVLYQYDYEEDPLSINLPDTIKSIDFKDSCVFNQQLFKLPRDLEVLILHEEYDYPLPNPLPVNLKYLDLGYRFNHQILELPNNLECLIMSNDYTQDLPIFPDTLTKLVIGNDFSDFNKPILSLPLSLIELKIGNTYGCYPLPDPLPPNLQKLTLGKEYNHPLSNNLPDTLIYLNLGSAFNHDIDNLPTSLQELRLSHNFDKEIKSLPTGLKKICFNGSYNNPLPNLPESLTHLTTSYFFNQELVNLPPTLEYLKLGCYFNKSLDFLPPSLLELHIGWFYNKSLNNLPPNLKFLRLDCKNLEYTLDLLPDTIETLIIPTNYGFMINKLPKNLKYLYFYETYKYYLELLNLCNKNNVYLEILYYININYILVSFTTFHLNLVLLALKFKWLQFYFDIEILYIKILC